jgi:hypothetical protein
MKITWLAWYISGVLALLAVAASAITYAPPGPGPFELALPLVFGTGAILIAGLAGYLSWLPSTHWIHRFRPVRAALITMAATITLLLVLVAG